MSEKKKIFIACDHGGLELKGAIKSLLPTDRFLVDDSGTYTTESVDYPDFAKIVCEKVLSSQDSMGILVCGSGQGMAISANRHKGIRAALCWSLESAKLSREHNDANVLCLGGRLIDQKFALEMLKVFLETPFAGDRHLRRIQKIEENA